MPEPSATALRTALRPSLGLAVTAAALSAPLLGLALLLGRPSLDVTWEHHPAHFWLVLGSAAIAAVLAYATGDAAGHRGDARLLLVSLAFLSASGFLGLHALATPGVLLAGPNAGFQLATPVGVALGSVFAALSAADVSQERAASWLEVARWLRRGLLGLLAVWGIWSIADLPPLSRPPQSAEGLPLLLAWPAVALYLAAAVRYAARWRRPAPVLLAVLAAFVLLAEAMLAIALADNWHLAWWEWHLLLLVSFALVALGARASWREERYADLYLPATSGATREISVLFADLQGFTSFSERHSPEEVTAMLNAYFEATVPAVVEGHGGDVDRIVGDALMVTFNKRGDQPDHARRAAAAGLDLQRAAGRVAAAHPEWPRFRVGVNSGPVSVTLLGAAGGRTHTIIGDTVNTAARIEGKAPAGGVAVGPATRALLPGARTTSLGALELKGKSEPVEAFLLLALDGEPT